MATTPEAADEAMRQALSDLLGAADGKAMRQALQRYPVLRQPGMDRFLTRRIVEAWAQEGVAACAAYLSARAFLAALLRPRQGPAGQPFALPLMANSPLIRYRAICDDRAMGRQHVELLGQTLGLIRRESEPDLWATIARELADALVKAGGAGRSARLREAIGLYRLALQIFARSDGASSARWADTSFALGYAWIMLRDGDLEAQRREALGCFEGALAARALEGDPVGWAQATRELALALTALPGRARASDQDRAIALLGALVRAAPAPPPAGWPEEQGRAWTALGTAYTYRLEGGREINLGQARAAYRQAERLLPRDRYPADWARIQYNDAIALLKDPSGRRAANLAAAVAALRRALEIYTPEECPDDWVLAQTALGTTLCQRELEGPRDQRLAEAIARYRSALEICSEEDDREHCATLQSNLANALAERGVNDPAEQEEAIALYQLALRGRPEHETPARWAETMNNLGVLYAERLSGLPAANRLRATECLRAALRVRTPAAFPAEARLAARNLGQIELAAGSWAAAADAYSTAIEAGDALYRMSISSTGRESELAAGRGLYAECAYALVRQGRLARAVECLEAGRARALSEGLALRQLVAATADEATQRRWLGALARIHTLEAELREGGARPLSELVAELEAERAKLPPLDEPLTLPAIGGQATARHALVYLSSVGDMAYAIVIGDGAPPRCVGPAPLRLAPWVAPRGPGQSDGPDDPLAALGHALIGPLAALMRERGFSAVTLIPCGQLGLLPIHAAPYEHEGRVRSLIDELTVAYAPGARVLAAARESAARRRGAPVLAGVGEPTPSDPPLPAAAPELLTIAALLGAPEERALTGDRATADDLGDLLPDATLVHLACHASFEPLDPRASSLRLARGEALSLADLLAPGFGGLAAARLVVLSACESAVTEARRLPDEVIGLPAGFLQAGAPTVVGTLWSARESSTALVMVRFYELLLAGHSPASALCQAQVWLRDSSSAAILASIEEWERREIIDPELEVLLWGILNQDGCPDPPFADRYYWAPFTIQGAAEEPL